MKTNKPILKNQGHSSSMQTPDYALDPLVPFLPKNWIYWDCACGKGNIVVGLQKRGFNCIGSDLYPGGHLSCQTDFLSFKLTDDWISRCIVTNPPYNIKDKFLQHAYELGLPFAFLLPIESLGGAKRQELYKKYGLEVILFPFRINFETPNGGSSAWFPTAWFTCGLNIGRGLTFVGDIRHG